VVAHFCDEVFISVVVPMYNEADNVEALYQRLTRVLEGLGRSYEIICVNDGSRDDTLEKLRALHAADPRLKVIDLSRNFGKEIALTAGLDLARGEVVIPIDADLQDPPELIPVLLEKWEEGYDVVYAVRTEREGESWLKKTTSLLFYKLMQRIARIDLPPNTGDFRLMSRTVANALREIRETHRFMKGLFSWVGFRQTGVYYQRKPRYAGRTKWDYGRLWNLAVEGITSFSYLPLQLATYLGFAVAMFSFAYGAYLIVKTLLFGNPVPGYPSLMVVILFLGGIQLLTIGILGEYMGRIYTEVKRRPLYFVRGLWGWEKVSEEAGGKK